MLGFISNDSRRVIYDPHLRPNDPGATSPGLGIPPGPGA
jgi:hypothetical protein